MDLLGTKILSMILLGGLSLLIGSLPLILRKYCGFFRQSSTQQGSAVLSCISCFGGGVILTTCFTHMLPEVNHLLDINISNGSFNQTALNIGEIFVLCGFFMIYIIEELTHLVIHKFIKPTKQVESSPEGHEVIAPLNQTSHQPQGGHGHSHDVALDFQQTPDTFQASVRGFLVILALSLHAVFEGIALGLASTTSSVWFLFFAIASHKYVISFCVGAQFVRSGISAVLNLVYVATFSLISPVGTGIGIALSETVTSESSLQTSSITVMHGLAAGTLIYVAFFEIIEKERKDNTNGLLIVGFLVLGFLSMIIIQVIEIQVSGGTVD